jgi:hypothetical protein
MGEPVIFEGRSAAVEALLAGSLPASVSAVREVPTTELSVLADLGAGELHDAGFRGLQVWPDLAAGEMAFGERVSLSVLRQGWLWVDEAFLDAVSSSGSRGDTARALVRRAAAMTARGSDAREWTEASPGAAALDELRSPRLLYPFKYVETALGRTAMSTPEFGDGAGIEDELVTGCVVEADDESMWVITTRRGIEEAPHLTVTLGDVECRASVVAADQDLLADALAGERGLPAGAPEVEAYARGLQLALLRVDRREHPDVTPFVIPLARDVSHLAPAVTMSYTAHPRAVGVFQDVFGSPVVDVVLVSAGVVHVARSSTTGPTLTYPTPVTAQQAGGGHAACVVGDPWPAAGCPGGPVLVHVGARDGTAEYALAGIALTPSDVDTDAGVVHRLFFADSAAVRALLRARPATSHR